MVLMGCTGDERAPLMIWVAPGGPGSSSSVVVPSEGPTSEWRRGRVWLRRLPMLSAYVGRQEAD